MSKKEPEKSTSDSIILQSIEVRPIKREERAQWDALVRQHHYLGLHSLIEETIRYVATHHEQWLALIGWSAAALKCKARDQWIGGASFLKTKHLSFAANNSRFLILPSLPIPNLASRVLALTLKRLSDDWQTLYGHPLYLAETFVDPRHFKGTCYKAQGWLFLGHILGFSKCSTRYYHHGNPKMVFVRLLHPDGIGSQHNRYGTFKGTRPRGVLGFFQGGVYNDGRFHGHWNLLSYFVAIYRSLLVK